MHALEKLNAAAAPICCVENVSRPLQAGKFLSPTSMARTQLRHLHHRMSCRAWPVSLRHIMAVCEGLICGWHLNAHGAENIMAHMASSTRIAAMPRRAFIGKRGDRDVLTK